MMLPSEERQMVAQAYLWHYIVAGLALVLLGVIGHVGRAVFNVFPDRLSDKPWMDMLISSGYNADDYLFGTEYDDAGYYKLDSWINFRNYTLACLVTGWAVMLLVPHASGLIAYGINESAKWLWELFLYRLTEVGIL
jgi:hypothetical protein